MDEEKIWTIGKQLDELGIEQIIEEYDAETVLSSKDGKWGFVESECDAMPTKNINLKYTTQEPKVCLKDLSRRIGDIDVIEVVSNPIDAKVTYDENHVNIAKNGECGMVQLHVTGRNYSENSAPCKANVFIQLN